MAGFYDENLAFIHSQGHTGWQQAAWPWLADLISRGPAPAMLHDLGCGDGAWLDHAAKAGLRVEGSDPSPAFVDMGQARGLRFTRARAAQAPWSSDVTAITALGEVLAYLDPKADNAPSLWPVAQAAARDLPGDGLLIADLIGPGLDDARHAVEGDGWEMSVTRTVEPTRLTRHISHRRKGGDWRDTVHVQAVFNPDDVAEGLERLGFAVQISDSYGPAPLLPNRFCFVARRR